MLINTPTPPENVLVTGATGRSGRWFVEQLARLVMETGVLPFGVTLIVRNPAKVTVKIPGVKVVQGDLTDKTFMAEVVKGHDTLLHIAGINMSEDVVRACLSAHDGPRWLVLVHTSGIYSRYKSAGEYYRLVESNIDDMVGGTACAVTILRPTMIYGSLADRTMSVFIKLVDRLRVFPLIGDGHTAIRPVLDADLGRAYLKVLLNHAATRNRNYDLSGGETIDFIDIFRTIGRLLGRKPLFVKVPPRLAYYASVGLYWVTLQRVDLREKVQRMTEARTYSNANAVKDFGFDPADFITGIRPEVEAYLASK